MKANTTLVIEPVRFAGVEAAIHRIVAGLHWLKIAHAERRARARAREEFETLDANALRDLGMHRSEFDSYIAEAWHQAEATRVRSGVGRSMEYGP
jgi:uncharacterized protein YjiS (DUF1127 family)